MGDTVNLAQRLQQWADPGETVLSEATYQALADPPAATELPPALVKGREAPVAAWKVAAQTAPDHDNDRSRQPRQGVAMHVMEARGVRKTYEADGAPVRALRGIDFTMDDTEFVAVMGPSGCGKSTLLNLVAGLDTPTEGEMVVAGESLADKDENALARMRRVHIGIVFQFFNLLEGMSVLENVTLPAVIAGARRRQAESRARDLLDMLGPGRQAGRRAGRAVGWPAPAPGHRPRPGQQAHAAAGRRAHRRPRLRRRPRGARAVPPPAHRGPGHLARDPRRRRGRGGHPHRAHARRAHRGRRHGRAHARRRERGRAPEAPGTPTRRRPRDERPGRHGHRHDDRAARAGPSPSPWRRNAGPTSLTAAVLALGALAVAAYAPVLGRHGNLATEVVRSVLLGAVRAGGRVRRGAPTLRAPGPAGAGRHRARGHRHAGRARSARPICTAPG